MEMQQIRYFVTLAKELNFTRAAERCNVSQPALTRAIQQLEQELGGPLFHRERNNTHLSELGRMMLPYLESIHSQTRAAKEQARAARKLATGTLTIGVMCTIGPQLIADLMIRFRSRHPDVHVVVTDGSARTMLDRLERGDLEIAIFTLPGEVPGSLHQITLFEERFAIVLPPNHRLSAREVLRGEDVNGETYVARTHCEVYETISLDMLNRGICLRKVFSSPRDDWVQGMIKAGFGVGLFPEFAVSDSDLLVRPLIEPTYLRTIYLTTVRGRPHSPAIGAFVQEARRHPWPASRFRAESNKDASFANRLRAAPHA